MSGPWTKYAQPPAEGPWIKYGAGSNDQPREAEDIVRGVRSSMANDAADEGASVVADVAKSAGVGLGEGAIGLAGLPGDISAAFNWAGDKLTDLAFGDDPKMRAAIAKGRAAGGMNLPSSADIKGGVEAVTGEFYEPETAAGDYARTLGQFAPAALAGPGGLARRAATQVAAPALASETAGQLTEGTAAEPYARFAGAVGGALIPSALSRAVTPLPISAERQAFVDTLQNEGVPLTAGQVTGNRGLQYAESMMADVPLASPRARDIAERQGEAFSAAAMRRVGENGPAVPARLQAARDRISQSFEDISSRNTVSPDAQFANDFGAVVQEYARVLPANQREVFGNMAGDIVDRFAGGTPMPGRDYQQIRSRLSRMAQSARGNDPEFSGALRGLRNALDDAFSRQVAPEDAAGLTTARTQYGNLKTIEKAAAGAGENAAFGRISPAQLRNSVAQGNNRGAYARGQGDFAELARAGNAVMTPLPNSGTAQRMAQGGQLLAAGGAAATGNLPMAGAILAGPTAASRVLHSRPVQGYLSNQVMTRLQSLPARQRAMIAAALEARGLLPPQAPAPVQ